MTETPSPQQAYISKVHLKGYKSIRDLEIDFKPGLNIIIGPNGSGKTNFLECLSEIILNLYYTGKETLFASIQIINSLSENYFLSVVPLQNVKRNESYCINKQIDIDSKKYFHSCC